MYLSQKQVPYTVRDIREDPQALQELLALGVRSTPCVQIGDTVIVGFNPRSIDKALAANGLIK